MKSFYNHRYKSDLKKKVEESDPPPNPYLLKDEPRRPKRLPALKKPKRPETRGVQHEDHLKDVPKSKYYKVFMTPIHPSNNSAYNG